MARENPVRIPLSHPKTKPREKRKYCRSPWNSSGILVFNFPPDCSSFFISDATGASREIVSLFFSFVFFYTSATLLRFVRIINTASFTVILIFTRSKYRRTGWIYGTKLFVYSASRIIYSAWRNENGRKFCVRAFRARPRIFRINLFNGEINRAAASNLYRTIAGTNRAPAIRSPASFVAGQFPGVALLFARPCFRGQNRDSVRFEQVWQTARFFSPSPCVLSRTFNGEPRRGSRGRARFPRLLRHLLFSTSAARKLRL